MFHPPTNKYEHANFPRITTIIKFGLAAFALGTFFEASVSAKAGQLVWVTA